MTHFPQPHSRGTHGFERALLADWSWTWDRGEHKDRIFIPAGVTYDPSIPTWAESLVPEDRLQAASLPHDVIYKLQGDTQDVLERKFLGGWIPVKAVGREYADRMFRAILREQGVASWRVFLAYRAVRWFGESAWREEDDFTLPQGTLYHRGE